LNDGKFLRLFSFVAHII